MLKRNLVPIADHDIISLDEQDRRDANAEQVSRTSRQPRQDVNLPEEINDD